MNLFGWPLILAGEILALIGIVLLFANARGFRAWLKFSVFYIPLAVILSFLIYPIRFAPGTPLEPVSAAVRPFGWLYLILTALIVLITRVRRNEKG